MRGGSRKGEHRGNAKPRTGLETPQDVMRAAVKIKGTPKPGNAKPSPRAVNVEQDVLLSQIVHGIRDASDMAPKEIALENMAVFQNKAYSSKALAMFKQQAEPASESRSREIAQLEAEEIQFRRMASEEAHRVMQFVHPRFAAVMVSGSSSTGESIVRKMLDMIDERNRIQPMVIEHTPAKRTA